MGVESKAFAAVGRRIKTLREAKGLSRRDLAGELGVDVSSLVNWEAGKHLPREKVRMRMARLLGCDLESLFAPEASPETAPLAAALVETDKELPALLMNLTRRTRHTLRALRFAAPYNTTPYVQTEWRQLVCDRLLGGTMEVHRVEIFYSLKRLQETLSNILRYNARPYYVKSYCAGLSEIAPFMGGYFFDDDEFLLGAYWSGMPPMRRPGIRVSGAPFRVFFNEYWNEIWQRGVWLNNGAKHDLTAARQVAEKLGLPAGKWDDFLDEARALQIGDGAPPLV
ncbi:MAG: helix-turn-helix transcriptional regulator [Alphaproteobacteria bacterium]|nr:helix-turn-helix transcriptional regulator [Alphaproteobacteria bacterium]